MHPRFQRLLGKNNFSIGLELPLDNDWSSAGQHRCSGAAAAPAVVDAQGGKQRR